MAGSEHCCSLAGAEWHGGAQRRRADEGRIRPGPAPGPHHRLEPYQVRACAPLSCARGSTCPNKHPALLALFCHDCQSTEVCSDSRHIARSTTDDPAVLSALMPWWHFVSEPRHERVRWTMCAREICFKNDLLRRASAPSIHHHDSHLDFLPPNDEPLQFSV